MEAKTKIPSYDDLFPGRFMRAETDLRDGEKTFTIKSLRLEEFPSQKEPGTLESKGILGFEETNRELALNITNGQCVKGLFGRETAGWIGKRLTLYAREVDAFGTTTWAVRVRGSPDMEKSKKIEIRANRQTKLVTMHKTDAPGYKPTAPPDMDTEHDEDNWHDEEEIEA